MPPQGRNDAFSAFPPSPNGLARLPHSFGRRLGCALLASKNQFDEQSADSDNS